MHLILTDSGLGGLTVCAALERALRDRSAAGAWRLTFVNAWPEEGRGYNDAPDMPARAAIFDGALRRIAAMQPDALVIACNTLSIVYPHTDFSGASPMSVTGIIEAGLDIFQGALNASPEGALVLLGTRTTIDSGVHRKGLLERGIAPARIGAASCHGLAAAIERGPDSGHTAALIDNCAARASDAAPAGEPLFVGLCCTHYAMVADRLTAAIARRTGRPVVALDPNTGLVDRVIAQFRAQAGAGRSAAPTVRVVSKVELKEEQRAAIAALLERTSPATAEALRRYEHVPELF